MTTCTSGCAYLRAIAPGHRAKEHRVGPGETINGSVETGAESAGARHWGPYRARALSSRAWAIGSDRIGGGERLPRDARAGTGKRVDRR